MNIQDLFAGYSAHVDAEEIAAEVALAGGHFDAGVTGLITGVTGLNGAVTGVDAAITMR
ncbi:LxmA leader domain family RiPP [Streptomyces tirandamycinicus]|uniref:LxmA leader domain family RiPP n=1 Tax=Streptomyces tirandamycinicus TaxID=2174846 RepID=UPI0034474485